MWINNAYSSTRPVAISSHQTEWVSPVEDLLSQSRPSLLPACSRENRINPEEVPIRLSASTLMLSGFQSVQRGNMITTKSFGVLICTLAALSAAGAVRTLFSFLYWNVAFSFMGIYQTFCTFRARWEKDGRCFLRPLPPLHLHSPPLKV